MMTLRGHPLHGISYHIIILTYLITYYLIYHNLIEKCLKRIGHGAYEKEMCRFAEDMSLQTHCCAANGAAGPTKMSQRICEHSCKLLASGPQMCTLDFLAKGCWMHSRKLGSAPILLRLKLHIRKTFFFTPHSKHVCKLYLLVFLLKYSAAIKSLTSQMDDYLKPIILLIHVIFATLKHKAIKKVHVFDISTLVITSNTNEK